MSFLAKLFINGRAINVLDTNIQFYQQINPDSFKPAALPRGGVFSITLEADGVTDLLGLALSPDTMCEGYIRFYRRDAMSKLVDYEFFDTYIVNYQREFTAFNGEPAIDRFVLSPGILRIGDMVFEKWWKVTDLAVKDASIVTMSSEPEKTPKVVDYYITDKNNQRIEKTEIGKTIFLNVKTKDMLGGTLSINLFDANADFKYNGEILSNDILSDIEITKNTLKFELEVVKQANQNGND